MTDTNIKLEKNVILIDASYVDKVAFNLTVNFERMLMRRIPKADLAHWLDCVALDGGITPGDNQIQVIFIYNKDKNALRHFTPSDFSEEIINKAFKDNIGEFTMSAYPIESNITDGSDFFLDTLTVILDNANVENVMVLPNVETYGAEARSVIRKSEGKKVTLFAMEPQAGSGFEQQILGYSLMSALGIKGDEL